MSNEKTAKLPESIKIFITLKINQSLATIQEAFTQEIQPNLSKNCELCGTLMSYSHPLSSSKGTLETSSPGENRSLAACRGRDRAGLLQSLIARECALYYLPSLLFPVFTGLSQSLPGTKGALFPRGTYDNYSEATVSTSQLPAWGLTVVAKPEAQQKRLRGEVCTGCRTPAYPGGSRWPGTGSAKTCQGPHLPPVRGSESEGQGKVATLLLRVESSPQHTQRASCQKLRILLVPAI